MMFQVQLEDCLHGDDSSSLVSLLLQEGLSTFTLTGLHQLVTKELARAEFCRVSVVLKALGSLSENQSHVQTLVELGLSTKVMLWFEPVRDMLTSDLLESSTPVLNLIQDFFDYFLLLVQASLPVSQLSVLLLHLIHFSLETRIQFPLRLQAIGTLNTILEGLSQQQRRSIQKQLNLILGQVAEAVLSAGGVSLFHLLYCFLLKADSSAEKPRHSSSPSNLYYELQVSLSEALCRLTSLRQRQQRANQWFSPEISSAFCQIRAADFEVDCRCFLNFVNSHRRDHRRVYTFPCFRAFLNSTQLFRPNDEKLQEFWIDFNAGSKCVSFFINEPQDLLWGAVHLLTDNVDHYHLAIQQEETVLRVHLKIPIMHQKVKGHVVELSFSSHYHLQLEEAVRRALPITMYKNSPGTSEGRGKIQDVCLTYGRKKNQTKSQLKVLPLSSPSSEDELSFSTVKCERRSRAEILFDQIKISTAKISCVPPRAESTTAQPQEAEPKKLSPIRKFQKESIKRSFPDSGYLSNQSEVAQKRKAEPGDELQESPEEEAGPHVKWVEPVTSDITAAFQIFQSKLEHHLTDRRRNVEDHIPSCLKECQQNLTLLLAAVSQARVLSLQNLLSSIIDGLRELERTCSALNSINSQMLVEIKRFASFCTENLENLCRLTSLDREESESGIS